MSDPLPTFAFPIGEDRHDAEWWLNEFETRFEETQDYAFKEAADLLREYIKEVFGGVLGDWDD